MKKTTIIFQGIVEIDEENFTPGERNGFITVLKTIDGLTMKRKHQFHFVPGVDLKDISERVAYEIFLND